MKFYITKDELVTKTFDLWSFEISYRWTYCIDPTRLSLISDDVAAVKEEFNSIVNEHFDKRVCDWLMKSDYIFILLTIDAETALKIKMMFS